MTDDPHVFDTYETLYADGRFSTGGTVTADRATLPFAGHASGDGSVLQCAGSVSGGDPGEQHRVHIL